MVDLLHKTGWILALVDILVVAAIIYRLALLLKETTAIRILLALPLLVIFYLLVQVSGLTTLRWLLDNLLASLVIILVIIFQHDIRRALLFFSQNRSVRGEDAVEKATHAVIEELVAAARLLAERSIGALIVIEREMTLDDFKGVGTEIDAKVSSELLTSIFLPYSPIHDGAVIIQRGKLTKAGCLLPLTQNPEIAKELGTRHRAAIGLTEVVDAVVIVISDERGAISLVENGRIAADLDETALRRILRDELDERWLQ